MNNHITREQLENYSTAFNSDRASRVACDAVMAGGLLGSCRYPAVIRKMNHEFSLTLKQ